MSLNKLGVELSCASAVELILSNTKENQTATLQKVMNALQQAKVRDQMAWDAIRFKLLWLRDWEFRRGTRKAQPTENTQGVLYQISLLEIETKVLKGALDAGCMSV